MSITSSDSGPDAVTNAFIKALDQTPKRVIDEKGVYSLSEWGVGDQRLALFFKLCRGLSRGTLKEYVSNVVGEAIKRGSCMTRLSEKPLLISTSPEQEVQGYVDLFVIAFHTRDIDDGKGERDLFYWMFLELYKYFPTTAITLLPLIPSRYGSWKDINRLLELLHIDILSTMGAFRKTPEEESLEKLEDALLLMFETKLFEDDKNSHVVGQKLSLCAKWAPRESGHFSLLARKIAIRMFRNKPDSWPCVDDVERSIKKAYTLKVERCVMDNLNTKLMKAKQSCYKRYRQLCARLNKHIQTAEVLMCDVEGKWDLLVPSAIPARCLKIHRKAFFNKTCKGVNKGQQRSERHDRVVCAENFEKHMVESIKNPVGNKKVHGKNLMPHEFVHIYTNEKELDLVLEAQWVDLRERLKALGHLNKFVVMADVSGSMSGIPMEVSIAFAILISELNHPSFRNRFLTFAEIPKWHILNEKDNLFQKVQSVIKSPWGYSTNFAAAIELILERCVEGKVSVKEVSELTFVIFSDMQFNTAQDSRVFSSKFQMIKKLFVAAGYKDTRTNEGIVPRIVFWNLRGDTLDFPCNSKTPGVEMVSGFSANGLKAFMNGEDMKTTKRTPYEGMRDQLDVERYDVIRYECERVGEIVSRATGAKYVAN